MNERYFRVILMYGHVGRGKSLEVARHITARNCVEAFCIGNRMPRVKKKSSRRGTISVVEISADLYAKRRAEEYKLWRYPAFI